MASIHPFRAYRYSSKAGDLANLLTQPYDKISPDMQSRYLRSSPYNLVRIILGERFPSDSEANNVYTRAAGYLNGWIQGEFLVQDPESAFFVYSQDFVDPDSGRLLTRTGFIGLGDVEEYSAGVVHRHEQTLAGPKKDRLDLLRHTHAHFGQIFMLYPDPAGEVDSILSGAARREPIARVTDEYGVRHSLWPIPGSAAIEQIQRLMSGKKLIIADGHHRYETALAFSKECSLGGARRVMMTFVNMHSPGLRILATHRLVAGLAGFDGAALLGQLAGLGAVEELSSFEALKEKLAAPLPDTIRIGVALAGSPALRLLNATRRPGDLDVSFLHQQILDGILGISEQAVREEKYLKYVRGMDAAVACLGAGGAQAAFLLQPTTVEQVAEVSFGGGVMPQKSTDFYPKLLSGMTIYKLDP